MSNVAVLREDVSCNQREQVDCAYYALINQQHFFPKATASGGMCALCGVTVSVARLVLHMLGKAEGAFFSQAVYFTCGLCQIH